MHTRQSWVSLAFLRMGEARANTHIKLSCSQLNWWEFTNKPVALRIEREAINPHPNLSIIPPRTHTASFSVPMPWRASGFHLHASLMAQTKRSLVGHAERVSHWRSNYIEPKAAMKIAHKYKSCTLALYNIVRCHLHRTWLVWIVIMHASLFLEAMCVRNIYGRREHPFGFLIKFLR